MSARPPADAEVLPVTWSRRLLTLLLAPVLLLGLPSPSPAEPHRAWTATWGTAPTGPGTPPVPAESFEDETLRQIVHTSVGGASVRVRLSNEFGTAPLVIGAARVARSTGGSGIAGDRRLTFGGRSSVRVPPGARRDSDPVALPVEPGTDLAVSLYLPRPTRGETLHGSAFQRNYVVPRNATRDPRLVDPRVLTSWFFLTGVSVTGPAGTIVAFGDSITDGAITTVDANHRWPDLLADRLRAEGIRSGVVNAGIGGNRLLHDGRTVPGEFEGIGPLFGPSALARFDRDVLARPGARYVVVLLGINDIGQPTSLAPPEEAVTVRELIAGYRRLIARAHAVGLVAVGATLTPFEGTTIAGYHSAENEAKRSAVNRWIRAGGEWDAVLDFDRAVRDPAHRVRMLPAYDSGDHLHPNDAGMRAMADAIPLRLFRGAGTLRAA
ncbi:MAG TPA: SGNH/GDSL hydrolase family protein [Mycobacteriales bacterium]|nr:SGNH/GDSL hydrolase family protein [Mycobacteriales bacterium]